MLRGSAAAAVSCGFQLADLSFATFNNGPWSKTRFTFEGIDDRGEALWVHGHVLQMHDRMPRVSVAEVFEDFFQGIHLIEDRSG